MSTFTLEKIAEITGGRYVGTAEAANTAVTGAVRDNREVMPGSLFVCIKGERTDGHLFANDAYNAGAVCCLAEHYISDAQGPYVIVPSTLESVKTLAAYYRSLFNIPVIGITGSVGKTTTKEMIASVLGERFCVHKTEKNLNNELGVPLTLLSMTERHEAAVIEMGISDFGEMSRLSHIVQPDMFVITNIGYSHTKELGDLHGVLRAKTEAFAYMSSDGLAVLNGDDIMLRSFDPGIKKITFGLGKHCDYYAEHIKTYGTNQIEADVVYTEGRFKAEIPAYGNHLAAIAPCAAAIGHLLGLTDDEIKTGLSNYTPIDGRSNVSIKNGVTIINDCYNANPASVKAALTSLAALNGRRTAVLGDMLNLGDSSAALHYDVGAFAAKCGIDRLVCCGEQARFIMDGFTDDGDIPAFHYPDTDSLAGEVKLFTKDCDVMLIKASRGMHFEKLLLALE